jgi:hypothetical protein
MRCNVPIFLISIKENYSSLIEFPWARAENNQGNMKNEKKFKWGYYPTFIKEGKKISSWKYKIKGDGRSLGYSCIHSFGK